MHSGGNIGSWVAAVAPPPPCAWEAVTPWDGVAWGGRGRTELDWKGGAEAERWQRRLVGGSASFPPSLPPVILDGQLASML